MSTEECSKREKEREMKQIKEGNVDKSEIKMYRGPIKDLLSHQILSTVWQYFIWSDAVSH